MVPKLKAKSQYDDRGYIKNDILPALGKQLVADVSTEGIRRLHNASRAKPHKANRIRALLSKAFNLAEEWGYRPQNTNPCALVKKFKEEKRERIMGQDELLRFGRAMDQAARGELRTAKGNARSVSPHAIAAIWLLFFTGARKSEILTLQWDHVDMERARLLLPDSKTGKKEIMLNGEAMAVLQDIPRVSGNPFVIVGNKQGKHLTCIKKLWGDICTAAGISGLRLHDLRHNFATHAVSNGVHLGLVGKMLGHQNASTTERYAHYHDNPVRAATL